MKNRRLVAFAFASIFLASTSEYSNANGLSFSVSSSGLWTDTSIDLADGPINVPVSITAQGSWCWDSYSCSGPDGDSRAGSSWDEWTPALKGSLIAYIGDNPWLLSGPYLSVGSSSTLTSTPGHLWLGFNDDKISHNTWDNRGAVDATISIPFDAIIRDSVHREIITYANSRQYEVGNFKPNFGLTLSQAAMMGGFVSFNWYQVIRDDAHLQRCIANPTVCVDIDKDKNGNILSVPYEDPPLGGYYKQRDDDSHGCWTKEEAKENEISPTTFQFSDSPNLPDAGDHLTFSTYLGGVDEQGLRTRIA